MDRGKGGGKTRPPSPSELPSAHSSSEEEEVQVEEEVHVEEEAGVEEEARVEEEETGVPLPQVHHVCGCEVPRPSRGIRLLLRDAH